MRWFLVLLVACTPKAPQAPTTLKVEITKPIPGLERHCDYLDEPPVPPEPVNLDQEDDDVVRRVFVHIRDYNDAVAWMHDAATWMGEVNTCLKVLQGEN